MLTSFLRFCVLVLTTYAGGWVGMWVFSLIIIKPAVERMRAEDPDRFICGNMFLGPMLLGFVVGITGGFCVGHCICRWVWPTAKPATDPKNTAPGTTPNNGA